jgi:hypothetical protein
MGLIRGLMDTDGGVRRGQAEFYTSSPGLAEQMKWLIQSIGGTCLIRSKLPKFTHKGETRVGLRSFTCAIRIADPSQLFHLSRKKNATKIRRFGYFGRTVESVRSIGVKPVQCIAVDHPEHLYITNGFTPTHNTMASAVLAASFFLADPDNTSVSLTSTSKQAMGGRVWGVLRDLHSEARDPDTGRPFSWHLINSQKTIQRERGDEKFNISCFAVETGELLKSIDKIKGRHTPRMFLIVDEANSTPDAIFHTIPNMIKGVRELVILIIGNALSYFDNHGRACEPMSGWPSITIDDTRWQTKGVPEWRMPGGLCCHYDGEKSPNVLAKKTIYPHIFSYENWIEDAKWGENSIHYWSQTRGFWPPEGMVNTVFSDPLIARCDGTGFLGFVANRVTYAFLDPAFGGDRCVLLLADVGETDAGLMGIQLRQPLYIEPKVHNEAERDYQIAREVIEQCKAEGVKPAQFGSDATGIGRGVHAIIAGEWSPEIQRVEWGGRASEEPSSQADGRPAHEVYDNRVTELWFRCREFLEAGQLKGLGTETVKQFCSREYAKLGRRYKLSTKPECKAKLGYSPDEADAAAGLCWVALRNGVIPMGKVSFSQNSAWQEITRVAEKDLGLAEDKTPDRVGFEESEVGIGINWRD